MAQNVRADHERLVLMTVASSRMSLHYFEHNSWAVKFHAYTLDNSCDLASAVQHYLPFPQARMIPGLTQRPAEAAPRIGPRISCRASGKGSVLRTPRDKACAPREIVRAGITSM
jgi:hypothetical protein